MPVDASAQTPASSEKTQVADAAESPTLATDPEEPPIDATANEAEKEETSQTLETNGLPSLAFEFGEPVETSEASTTANEVGEPSAETEKSGAKTLGDAAEPVEALGSDAAPPKTVDDLLKRYERGWTPSFRDAVPDLGAENDGGGNVGGSTDLAARSSGRREKVEALAAELEKAARERIDAVAGKLETSARERVATFALEAEKAARAKAEAAEVKEAARTEIDELSLAVAMSAGTSQTSTAGSD